MAVSVAPARRIDQGAARDITSKQQAQVLSPILNNPKFAGRQKLLIVEQTYETDP